MMLFKTSTKWFGLIVLMMILSSLLFVICIPDGISVETDTGPEAIPAVKIYHNGTDLISVDLSPLNDMVAVGLVNGTVMVYNTTSWDLISVMKMDYWVYDVVWCPAEEKGLIAVSSGSNYDQNRGGVKIYSSVTWKLVEEIDYGFQIHSISWTRDGTLLAVAASSCVEIFTTGDWIIKDNISLPGNETFAVKWHPYEKKLAIGRVSWEHGGFVDIYDPDHGIIASRYLGFIDHHLFNPTALSWESRTGWLGIGNCSLFVMDMEKDMMIFDPEIPGTAWINDIVWTNNSFQFLVANGRNIELYDINQVESTLISEMPYHIKAMEISSDKKILLVCAHDTLHILTLTGFESGEPINDLDEDGVIDKEDAFPTDPAASKDLDSDGYPGEWNTGMNETDSTTGLELDMFPMDPNEWVDSDNDTIGNNADRFPFDPAAWEDSDVDGYPDRWNPGKSETDSTKGLKLDVFPLDPYEWSDLDGDGTGDNSDVFPTDPGEWADSDLDGFGNNGDEFPTDPAASVDTDDDGYPDRWNPGKTIDDSTTGLTIDVYPLNPLKHSADEDQEPQLTWFYIAVILFTLLIIPLLAVILIVKSRRSSSRYLTPEEEKIRHYREDILLGLDDLDFNMSDQELLEILSKKKKSGEISAENYTFIIEKVLAGR